MATGWLRLLVFSSFCSGIPAAEKRNSYAEIFLTFLLGVGWGERKGFCFLLGWGI
jgi:hypothetical protein